MRKANAIVDLEREQDQANRLIEQFGGVVKTANLCNLTQPAVSVWKNKGIPRYWKLYFKTTYPKICDFITLD